MGACDNFVFLQFSSVFFPHLSEWSVACQPHPNLHASLRGMTLTAELWCMSKISANHSLVSNCLTRKSVPLNEEKTIDNLPLVPFRVLITFTRYFALVVREKFSLNQTSNVSIRFDMKFYSKNSSNQSNDMSLFFFDLTWKTHLQFFIPIVSSSLENVFYQIKFRLWKSIAKIQNKCQYSLLDWRWVFAPMCQTIVSLKKYRNAFSLHSL